MLAYEVKIDKITLKTTFAVKGAVFKWSRNSRIYFFLNFYDKKKT